MTSFIQTAAGCIRLKLLYQGLAYCSLDQQWKYKDMNQLHKSSLRIYEVIKAEKYRFMKKRFYKAAFKITLVNF